ncbi:SLC26A/SulP transporter [Phytophthora cactorum]|nr:SLC26A/SulP transporter [Phytophthora cactorum]
MSYVESIIGVFCNAHATSWVFLWTPPATEAGWTLPRTSPLIDLVDFNEVHWSQLPKQLGTWFGIFIVEFLYGLDIAAIELDMGISLVFNHELKAVNWSNFVSDRLGGYTGSYILL